jgi:hypothetical protein
LAGLQSVTVATAPSTARRTPSLSSRVIDILRWLLSG